MPLFKPIKRSVLILLLAFYIPGISHAVGAGMEGKVTVLQGDTLLLDNVRIHLQGLVSPPRGTVCKDVTGSSHACGDAAANALHSIINNSPVKCLGTEFNHEGHLRGMCYIGTKNLNGTMVRAGWALSEGRYGRWHESLEKKAKEARAGLWADGSGDPWEWDW